MTGKAWCTQQVDRWPTAISGTPSNVCPPTTAFPGQHDWNESHCSAVDDNSRRGLWTLTESIPKREKTYSWQTPSRCLRHFLKTLKPKRSRLHWRNNWWGLSSNSRPERIPSSHRCSMSCCSGSRGGRGWCSPSGSTMPKQWWHYSKKRRRTLLRQRRSRHLEERTSHFISGHASNTHAKQYPWI